MTWELFPLGKRAESFVHVTTDDRYGLLKISIGANHQVVYLNPSEAADLRDVLQQAMPAPQQGGAA